MSTLAIITVAVVALLCLNSVIVVYLRRRRGAVAAPIHRRKLTAAGVALYAAMVAALIVGVAAPSVAPGSSVAGFVKDAGILTYTVWCVVGAIVVGGLLALMRISVWRNDGAA